MPIKEKCPICLGGGYVGDDVCTTCFGGGLIPINGMIPEILKKLDDIEDKVNDVMNKCNDILEAI